VNPDVTILTRIIAESLERAPKAGGRKLAAHGFTLIELMVTIAIVAIVAAFAIPAFKTNSPSMEANELLGALQYARFAAIKNAQNVIVCPLASGSTNTCGTTTAWNTGWLVFAPASNTCSAPGGATGDVVLKTQSGFGTSDTATFSVLTGNSNASICFNRLGFVNSSSTGKVTINNSTNDIKQQRCVVVSGVGHMQVLSNGQTDINTVTCP
jgi:type IV fimbrial biogenesis protein FimT